MPASLPNPEIPRSSRSFREIAVNFKTFLQNSLRRVLRTKSNQTPSTSKHEIQDPSAKPNKPEALTTVPSTNGQRLPDSVAQNRLDAERRWKELGIPSEYLPWNDQS